MDPNYTLGRGELHFNKFRVGTKSGIGERYMGNSPEFSLNSSVESLDHYSSDRGIKEKDDSVTLQITRGGSFTLDDINTENLALMFLGDAGVVSQTAATALSSDFTDVTPGMRYQLGESATSPTGDRSVTNVVVTKIGTPATTYAAGTDYLVNPTSGALEVIEGGAIIKGTGIHVVYDRAAIVMDRVISGTQVIEGALKFRANNPKGKNMDYFFPWVKVTPNGDYALKGDEWQTMSFNIEVLTRPGYQAVIVTSQPRAAA